MIFTNLLGVSMVYITKRSPQTICVRCCELIT